MRPCLPFPKGGGRESWKTDKKAGEKEERCREAKLSRSSSAVRVDLPSPPPLASEAVSLRWRRLVSSSSSKECLLVSFPPPLVAPIILSLLLVRLTLPILSLGGGMMRTKKKRRRHPLPIYYVRPGPNRPRYYFNGNFDGGVIATRVRRKSFYQVARGDGRPRSKGTVCCRCVLEQGSDVGGGDGEGAERRRFPLLVLCAVT